MILHKNDAAVYELTAKAIEVWQTEVHWWGEKLPSHSIADSVLDALYEAGYTITRGA